MKLVGKTKIRNKNINGGTLMRRKWFTYAIRKFKE